MKKTFIIFLIGFECIASLSAQGILQKSEPGFPNKVFLDLGKLASRNFYLGYERKFFKGKAGLLIEGGRIAPYHNIISSGSPLPEVRAFGIGFQARYYPVKFNFGSEKFTVSPFVFFGGEFQQYRGVAKEYDNILGQRPTRMNTTSNFSLDTGFGVEFTFFKRLTLDMYTGPQFQRSMNIPLSSYYQPWNGLRWRTGLMLGFKF